LELAFSTLETRLDPIIDKAVTAARQNQNPGFSIVEHMLWDRFFILQYKRVPDLHQRIATVDDFDVELKQLLAHVLEHRPDKSDEVAALGTPESRKRLYHNSKVAALLRPSPEVEAVLSKRGIAVIRIARLRKSFIIGSNPVVKFTFPGCTHILDPSVEIWLPVAFDVAIGIGLHEGTESVIPITEPSWIRHINDSIAHQSTIYAGPSKELICSLSGQRYRGRD
jgi:hypothetical protein